MNERMEQLSKVTIELANAIRVIAINSRQACKSWKLLVVVRYCVGCVHPSSALHLTRDPNALGDALEVAKARAPDSRGLFMVVA